MTDSGDALSRFRPADNKSSVRAFQWVAIVLALTVGLLSLLWLFAVLTGATIAMVLWVVIATPTAVALMFAGIVPNWALYKRHGSQYSRQGYRTASVATAVFAIQIVIVWLRPWNPTF